MWKHVKDEIRGSGRSLPRNASSSSTTTQGCYFWMCLFLPSLPLTSPSLLSPGPTHPSYGGDEGGIKEGRGGLGHITLLKVLYFVFLHPAPSFLFLHLSLFLCLPAFTSSCLLLSTTPLVSILSVSVDLHTAFCPFCHSGSALVPIWV